MIQEEGIKTVVDHSINTSNAGSQLDATEILDRFKQSDEHIHTCPTPQQRVMRPTVRNSYFVSCPEQFLNSGS